MNETRSFAFFDFDGTMIPGDSIAAYVRYARELGVMSRKEFGKAMLMAAGYLLGRVSAAESKNAALAFRRRLYERDRETLDRDFVRDRLLPRVYPQARACIQRHAREGRGIVIVTASTENYMRFAAEALGADALLATPLKPDGTVGENCRGEEKIRRVREWLESQGMDADFSRCWAYGDSKSDLPMLRLCGHSVQVNPKRALRKAAPDMERETWGKNGIG